MNGSEYAEFNNIQAINDNGEPYFTQEEVDSFGEGTDWQDIVFSDAPILTTSLDVTGGNKKTQFSIGGSLYDQEGIIKGSDYTRYSLRTNIEHEVSDFFKVSLTNSLSRIGRESRDSGGGARGNSLIGAAISAAPISSPYNEDGTYTDLANAYPFIAPDIRNPLNFINEQTNEVVANVVLTNAALIFNPIPELTVKIAGGVENRDDRTDFYTTRNFINSNGTASVSTSQFTSLLSENTISYSDTFGEKHEVSAVAGFTYQDFLTKFVSGSGSGFLTDLSETHDLGAAAVAGIPSSGYSKSVLLSGLGRVNYSFDNKYLATVSFRSDGSSRYSEGNKWGYFPSAALAWKVSEEDFFTENDVISGLKIRTSWGLTGSQAISPYSTLNLLNSGNTVFGNTLYPLFGPSTRLPGALKWETTEQIDFGVDVGFLQNHLRINADYYVKNTRDLLNTVRLPSSMGFTTTIQNVGEVQNKGFELGVDAKVFTGDFRWDLFGNIGFNSNEVISLYNGEDILGGFVNVIAVQDNVNILREGRPIGQFWGYVEDGYTEEGMIQYRDLNDDGAINADDKTYIGDPNPDFTYGLNSSMAYKNLELTLFIQGTQGNDIFNVSAIPSTLDYGQGINMPREVLLDHWTPQNTDAKYPIISRNSSTQVSDRWVEDGSYLRLKNIQLAYNFNKLGLGLENLQVYASGQNLITLTDYSWWDPGVNSGIDHYSYPVSKVVTFGFRATF
jgi:TonB-linked SusC/RagA family outer membrane protein